MLYVTPARIMPIQVLANADASSGRTSSGSSSSSSSTTNNSQHLEASKLKVLVASVVALSFMVMML
jgi:hypothetical protein